MKPLRFMSVAAPCVALAVGAVACGGQQPGGGSGGGGGGGQSQQGSGTDFSQLSGTIRIDGSSTVQPFAEAAVELFSAEAPNVNVSVGGAGTGDGFERFCRGETQISDASRPIEAEEVEACEAENIEPVELPVAQDALSIVTNPETMIPQDCINFDQLNELLAPDATVSNLSELGQGFPDQEVSLFTPGTESGTFDYFTEVVLETDAEQRTEGVQTSADDNQLVTGVSGTPGGLGYFGFSFADQNRDKLKILQVAEGDSNQCVAPSIETVQSNQYPLSRPLLMYPSREALQKPEVKGFLTFVAENYQRIAEAANIVPMSQQTAQQTTQIVKTGQGGEPKPETQ
ncbi:MAG TPA: phosphate ABC transporter substrate-binding protein PstS family protein [Solirubrobacteraceae bacterium]|nr:phosphate ABC transporter substrate-binding protein PstS family protein [Solirubrobacteraceae bacterium]